MTWIATMDSTIYVNGLSVSNNDIIILTLLIALSTVVPNHLLKFTIVTGTEGANVIYSGGMGLFLFFHLFFPRIPPSFPTINFGFPLITEKIIQVSPWNLKIKFRFPEVVDKQIPPPFKTHPPSRKWQPFAKNGHHSVLSYSKTCLKPSSIFLKGWKNVWFCHMFSQRLSKDEKICDNLTCIKEQCMSRFSVLSETTNLFNNLIHLKLLFLYFQCFRHYELKNVKLHFLMIIY